MKSKKTPSLSFCIIMDVLGMLTYIIPIAGEWFDILWAPVSAVVFYYSFNGRIAKIGSIIDFLEELFPFTDFIPTFTLSYFYNKYFSDQNQSKS